MKFIQLVYYYFFKFPYYKMVLGKIGSGSKLISPMLSGSKRIFIGKKVYVRKNTWLAAEPVTGDQQCRLVIGDGTYVGNFCHFYSSSLIEIGEKVLFADKVYVSDNLHSYNNIHLPVIEQPIRQLSPVTIGSGAWIGENVCIIGCTIGRNAVIGANAVVTTNIPDYCVAVGAPAKIIKRFDMVTNEWKKTNELGQFI